MNRITQRFLKYLSNKNVLITVRAIIAVTTASATRGKVNQRCLKTMSTKVQSRYARMKRPIPTSPVREVARKHCEMSSQYENLYSNTGTNPREEARPEKRDSSISSGKSDRKWLESKEFKGRFSNSWPQTHKSGSKHSVNSRLSCRSADRNRSVVEPKPPITRYISSDDIVIAQKEPSSQEIIRYARKKPKKPGENKATSYYTYSQLLLKIEILTMIGTRL